MGLFLWLCKILKNNNLGWMMGGWNREENVCYMHFVHHYHSLTRAAPCWYLVGCSALPPAALTTGGAREHHINDHILYGAPLEERSG